MMKTLAFIGQAYYNTWVLKKSLAKLGWVVTLLDIDSNLENKSFYHGRDLHLFDKGDNYDFLNIWQLEIYLNIILNHQVFHFSNMMGIRFLPRKHNKNLTFWISGEKWYKLISFIFNKICKRRVSRVLKLLLTFRIIKLKEGRYLFNKRFHSIISKIYEAAAPYCRENWDIYIIKEMGGKISYANNACQDGVSQSSFSQWGPVNTCSLCAWNNVPEVCSDEKNLKWGKFRNEIADLQFTSGSNRADYNICDNIYEVPEFYCLDEKHWSPMGLIPSNYKLSIPDDTFKIYHSVGNYDLRTSEDGVNIKCTHIYIDVVNRLKQKGHKVELVFIKDIKNTDIKYYLNQADIVVDMLTFGYFGANVREALMMGKPSICFLRPEWIEQISSERPNYAEELPVISATIDTVEEKIEKLIIDKDYYKQMSEKSRSFALKYHSSKAGAHKVSEFLEKLI